MSKNRKICDIYRKNNRLYIDLNLKLMHNKTIETQKNREVAMQIKITVDIDNTDILKFFELFKKDLATVAKNTTVETVAEEQPKNESADISAEKPQKKAQKKQPKNDCADFTGVQETTEEKSDNTADNSLEHDFNFNAAPINAKVEIVKNILVSMAKGGRKTEAKDILTKNKVPALSKLCDAEEKILVKIYNEVKNAQ
jgi:hypothetical protein